MSVESQPACPRRRASIRPGVYVKSDEGGRVCDMVAPYAVAAGCGLMRYACAEALGGGDCRGWREASALGGERPMHG